MMPGLRRYMISDQFMAELFSAGIKPGYAVLEGAIPEDGIIVNAWHDPNGRYVTFLVQSESFTPVEPGQPYPTQTIKLGKILEKEPHA